MLGGLAFLCWKGIIPVHRMDFWAAGSRAFAILGRFPPSHRGHQVSPLLIFSKHPGFETTIQKHIIAIAMFNDHTAFNDHTTEGIAKELAASMMVTGECQSWPSRIDVVTTRCLLMASVTPTTPKEDLIMSGVLFIPKPAHTHTLPHEFRAWNVREHVVCYMRFSCRSKEPRGAAPSDPRIGSNCTCSGI